MNVIAVCNFNMRFTFAASGFEGSMHDYNIFKRVVNDPVYRFPKPETGIVYSARHIYAYNIKHLYVEWLSLILLYLYRELLFG